MDINICSNCIKLFLWVIVKRLLVGVFGEGIRRVELKREIIWVECYL